MIMVKRNRLRKTGAGAKKRTRLVRVPKEEIPEREQLIHPYLRTYGMVKTQEEKEKWSGGLRYFKNMPIEVVEQLMKKKFLNPKDRQNVSPTAQEMLDFMKKMKKLGFDVRAHGYEISADRDDTRVTIEGVMTADEDVIHDSKFRKEWVKFNAEADELNFKRSWWD